MKQNIQGFELKKEWALDDGVLYEYIHKNTKAKLLYMPTTQDNKLFSVAFTTTPHDDTGVFHILEHSVLNGSEKYPVREPFVELLKSSMNTFLNAITFPDKTMYPVSSRNEKDLLNLMSVYLDAVFAPTIYNQPNTFYQEGWHYDYDETNDTITYKGVVFNEMKGAESSVDNLINRELSTKLFPDTCYGCNSGGDTKKITDLTYEQFIETHRKYYHPSHAIFYLEGNMDIDQEVSLIEQYMDQDPIDPIEIAYQKPIKPQDSIKYYPIAPEESLEAMTRISYGRILCDYKDKEKIFATNILCGYLCDSNDSPLKRIILENGLAQDVYMQVADGVLQPMLQLHLINTEEENAEKIQKAIQTLIDDIKTNGIDQKALEATLNQMEFQYRDVNEPQALYHNILILNSYLYGGDPTLYLNHNNTFKYLREQLSTNYYIDLLLDLLDLSTMLKVTFKPSKQLEKENLLDEQKRLQDIQASWNEEKKQEIIQLNENLKAWQSSEDSLEALNTIPKLKLSDVDEKPIKYETTVESYKQSTILKHPSSIDGITYLNMYFAIPSAYQDMLAELVLVTSMLGKLPTKNKSLFALTQDIKMHLGAIDFDMDNVSKKGDTKYTQTSFLINCSVLSSKIDDAKRIISEILFETDFDLEEQIEQLLIQFQNYYRDNMITSGHRFGMMKACADLSSYDAAKEAYEGVSCYVVLKEIIEDFASQKQRIMDALKVLREEILTQANLTCSLTTKDDIDITSFIDSFKEDTKKDINMCFTNKDPKTQMIRIPAAISYAVIANNIKKYGEYHQGAWEIVAQITTYSYLWNEIRVKNGAYGTGMTINSLGNMMMHSYRDPNFANSFGKYKEVGSFLKNIGDMSLDGFIISRIAEKEPLLSPRGIGMMADLSYFKEETYEDLCKLRTEMLNVTSDDLIYCGEIMDQMFADMKYCLVSADNKDYPIDQEYNI